MDEPLQVQSKKQKIISFVTSDNSSIVLDLIKLVIPHVPLVAESSHQTIVNAVKIDTLQQLILDLDAVMLKIKEGKLHEVNF